MHILILELPLLALQLLAAAALQRGLIMLAAQFTEWKTLIHIAPQICLLIPHQRMHPPQHRSRTITVLIAPFATLANLVMLGPARAQIARSILKTRRQRREPQRRRFWIS